MVDSLLVPVTAPRSSSRATRATLNRLLVAARDESIALHEAVRYVEGTEARRWLLQLALRRDAVQRDLANDVVNLGGAPERALSFRARWGSWQRAVSRLLLGPHQGDAYDCCARAAARTSRAYSAAIDSSSTDQVRQRLERELVEVNRDCDQLRNLRWGAPLAARP
jgi:uncharacterized protein (TIGR02284 family)